MKERPILFNGEMVRAILDGLKTQTRRTMKPQPDFICQRTGKAMIDLLESSPYLYKTVTCPYGKPGDRLWVRETFIQLWNWDQSNGQSPEWYDEHGNGLPGKTFYRADLDSPDEMYDSDGWIVPVTWKPSIHMPRTLSRITLQITNIRVDRVQAISEADSIEEGWKETSYTCDTCSGSGTSPSGNECFCDGGEIFNNTTPIEWYRALWDKINGKKYPWHTNPFVWVIEFERVKE